MKIGNLEVKPVSESVVERLACLIWGQPGSGKTTLACTAPGEKLIINLDPDGPTSVGFRGDVHVLDLSKMSTDDVMKELEHDSNPLGITKFLNENPKIETVILDSLSSLAQRALEKAVKEGVGAGKHFRPTMMTPGISAYGGRNAIVLTCVKGLLRATGRANAHLILISHEAEPEKDDKGVTLYITMMLGGQLVNQMALQIGEVWWLQDGATPKSKTIAIRQFALRKPMKTRMFVTDSDAVFSFAFDYQDWKSLENNPIAKWWSAFEKGKGKKLPLPTLSKQVKGK